MKGVLKLLQNKINDTLSQNIDVEEQNIKAIKAKDFLGIISKMINDYNYKSLN